VINRRFLNVFKRNSLLLILLIADLLSFEVPHFLV
jgi:hypothetical protein